MWEWTESCWADFGCGVIHTISTVNDFTSIMLEEEESQSHKPAQDWTVKNPTSKCTKWTGWSLEKKAVIISEAGDVQNPDSFLPFCVIGTSVDLWMRTKAFLPSWKI